MPDTQSADDAPAITAAVSSGTRFATVRRGLEPGAVHRFVAEAEMVIASLRARERELTERLVDAERRAAEPVLDEETLTTAVGTETAKVLRAAHEAARDVVARAEARSSDLLAQAGALLAERTREADAEARAAIAHARDDAAALVEATKDECRTMVEEAREARRRILADLAGRRRTLHVQLEQLRAGKDALAGIIEQTSRSVKEIQATLVGSESEARLAADRAAEIATFSHDDISLDALVDEVLGPLALAEVDAEDEPARADADADENPGETAVEVDASAEPPLADVDETAEASRDADPAGDPDADLAHPESGDVGHLDEPSTASAPGHGVDSHPVDDLFARLRAEREGTATTGAEREGTATTGAEVGGLAESVERAEPVQAFEPKFELARRDELLAPVRSELARILKRELRSDQNELLDSLRNLERGSQAGGLVPGDLTSDRLATTTATVLGAAWRAGIAFASPGMDVTGISPGPEAADAAQELALEVVTSLRARLEGALVETEDDGAAAEIVGAAYRQWRGERIEDLAGDYVTRVFSKATLDQLGTGVLVSWIVDDGDDRCPDCDDNALAGPQMSGEAFPTGQLCPPVHPGCRCVLVPAGY